MKTWHAFISDRHRGGDVLCEVADPDHCGADRILPGTLLAVRPLSANDFRDPGNRQRDAGQAPLNHDHFTLKRIRRWRSNWRTRDVKAGSKALSRSKHVRRQRAATSRALNFER